MSDNTVVPLGHPDTIEDPLTAVLRSGARRLLAQAVEAEAEAFLAEMKGVRLPDGRERLVRHGHGPERLVQTGIGPVPVRRAKLRDRGAGEGGGERIRFASAILPAGRGGRGAWMPAADPLPARGLDGRLRGGARGAAGQGRAEPVAVGHRPLAGRVGGGPRALAAARPVGAALRLSLGGWRLPAGPHGATGRVHAGADRRDRGGEEGTGRLPSRPARERAELAGTAGRPEGTRPGDRTELATGDGALGFWKALEEVCATTRHQRCWVHKTSNVLDKLPKSVQPAAKRDLREIWQAPDRTRAEAAITTFAEKYGAKYGKAVACLAKDREALLCFYDFPAEHWDHLRTSNPSESVFATVRHGRWRQGCAVAGHRPADGVQAGHGRAQNRAPAEGREPVAQGDAGQGPTDAP